MKKYFPSAPLSGLSPELNAKYAALRERQIREFLANDSSKAYRAGQWLKALVAGDPVASRWCRDQGLIFAKANATNTDSAGGVLVPEQVAGDILVLLETYGVCRQEARTWPMLGDSEVVPRGVSGFSTAWMTQNSAGSFSQPGFDGITLSSRKLASFTKISSDLFEDGGEKLGAFFVAGVALAFAQAEDAAMFNGDGSSGYAGILGIANGLTSAGKVTAASGHNSFGTIDGADIGNAIAALSARAMRNAKIYISVTGYGAALVRLAAAGGGLVATVAEDGTLRANWHGLPVVFTQALPTSAGSLSGKMMLAVGDLDQAVAFGVRRDVTLQWFKETFAEFDQVLMRATERVDINAHDLGTDAASGAIVGLFAP